MNDISMILGVFILVYCVYCIMTQNKGDSTNNNKSDDKPIDNSIWQNASNTAQVQQVQNPDTTKTANLNMVEQQQPTASNVLSQSSNYQEKQAEQPIQQFQPQQQIPPQQMVPPTPPPINITINNTGAVQDMPKDAIPAKMVTCPWCDWEFEAQGSGTQLCPVCGGVVQNEHSEINSV